MVSLENEKNRCKRCTISPDDDVDRCIVVAPPLHGLGEEAKDSEVDRCIVSDAVIVAPNPAAKARLWDDIRSKMKKYARADNGRRGLAVSDLSPEERAIVEAAGWQHETTNNGISLLWAPDKTLASMGMGD